MTHKNEALYRAVFMTINENVMDLKSFTHFMSDYETAMRNAIKQVIPLAVILACWFHFVQACKRFARKLQELMEFIKQGTPDGDAGKALYYRLLCLPLLPASKIRNAFEGIKVQAFALNKKAFQRFLKYMDKQWMKKVKIRYSLHIYLI